METTDGSEAIKKVGGENKDKSLLIQKKFLEFYPDVVEVEHRSVPGGARWTLYLIILLLISLVAWASYAKVDRIVKTRGRLITTSSTIVLQPLATSVVRTVDAQVGQMVKAGQILITLDPTFAKSDLDRLEKRLKGLHCRVRRLEAEISETVLPLPGNDSSAAEKVEYQIFLERNAHYKNQIKAYDSDIKRLIAKYDTNLLYHEGYSNHVAVLSDIEAMYSKMAKAKQGSKLDFLRAKERRVEVQSDLFRLQNEKFEIVYENSSVKFNKAVFKAKWKQDLGTELSEKRLEKFAVEEEFNKAKRINSLIYLASPSDAVVLEVAKLSIGSVVREAEKLATLVPLDVPLEAEVEIPTKDIGRVRIGDDVRIKLDPFPFQKHGTLHGTIRTLSNDSFSKEIADGVLLYFRSRIDLKTTKLENVPDDFILFPGMTLSGEVKVGTRCVISYFLYPLIRALDESIREP